jgi:peroxiredoxin
MGTRISIALLLAVFLSLAPAAFADQLSPFTIESFIGNQAPDFTLTDQKEQPVTLSAFRGRPVLLNFWAPWAPNSLDEVKTLAQLRDRADMKNLVILGITVDKKPDAAQALLQQNPVNYPILTDPGLVVTMQRYAAFMVPLTIMIDRNGIVTKIYYGQQEWLRPKMLQSLARHIK